MSTFQSVIYYIFDKLLVFFQINLICISDNYIVFLHSFWRIVWNSKGNTTKNQ